MTAIAAALDGGGSTADDPVQLSSPLPPLLADSAGWRNTLSLLRALDATTLLYSNRSAASMSAQGMRPMARPAAVSTAASAGEGLGLGIDLIGSDAASGSSPPTSDSLSVPGSGGGGASQAGANLTLSAALPDDDAVLFAPRNAVFSSAILTRLGPEFTVVDITPGLSGWVNPAADTVAAAPIWWITLSTVQRQAMLVRLVAYLRLLPRAALAVLRTALADGFVETRHQALEAAKLPAWPAVAPSQLHQLDSSSSSHTSPATSASSNADTTVVASSVDDIALSQLIDFFLVPTPSHRFYYSPHSPSPRSQTYEALLTALALGRWTEAEKLSRIFNSMETAAASVTSTSVASSTTGTTATSDSAPLLTRSGMSRVALLAPANATAPYAPPRTAVRDAQGWWLAPWLAVLSPLCPPPEAPRPALDSARLPAAAAGSAVLGARYGIPL
mgnify:CR=1 FL=1